MHLVQTKTSVIPIRFASKDKQVLEATAAQTAPSTEGNPCDTCDRPQIKYICTDCYCSKLLTDILNFVAVVVVAVVTVAAATALVTHLSPARVDCNLIMCHN